MAFQAVKMIDRYGLLERSAPTVTVGLPTSQQEAAREVRRVWQQESAATAARAQGRQRPSAPATASARTDSEVRAQAMYYEGKEWRLSDLVRIIEQRETMIHFSGERWDAWIPKGMITYLAVEADGEAWLGVSLKFAVLAGIKDLSRGKVKDVG